MLKSCTVLCYSFPISRRRRGFQLFALCTWAWRFVLPQLWRCLGQCKTRREQFWRYNGRAMIKKLSDTWQAHHQIPEYYYRCSQIAVLVRLHDCEHVFLPCQSCPGCISFNSGCPDCLRSRDELKGVFAVQPLTKSWRYDGRELQGQYINVSQRQLPLAPAKVLPLYSMQGMTADPGLVAH